MILDHQAFIALDCVLGPVLEQLLGAALQSHEPCSSPSRNLFSCETIAPSYLLTSFTPLSQHERVQQILTSHQFVYYRCPWKLAISLLDIETEDWQNNTNLLLVFTAYWCPFQYQNSSRFENNFSHHHFLSALSLDLLMLFSENSKACVLHFSHKNSLLMLHEFLKHADYIWRIVM